jgi:tRNA-dihydrouridine synthase B
VTDFSWIPKVKSVVSIPIIANGSLDTPQKIIQAFYETGCDGVMIGRGAIENPWIFQQTKYFLQTNTLQPDPTIEDRFRVLIDHLILSTECKGEKKGVIEFRKHYSGYLKGLYGASKVRQEMMHYLELQPAIERLYQYRDDLVAHADVHTLKGTVDVI